MFVKSFMLWFVLQSGLHRTHHEIYTKDVRFHLFQWFVAKHHLFLRNKVGRLLSNNFNSCVQFVFIQPLWLQLETTCHPSIEWFFRYSSSVSSTLMIIIITSGKSLSFETSRITSYALVRPPTLLCRLLRQWTMSMSNSSIYSNHQTSQPLRLNLLTKKVKAL